MKFQTPLVPAHLIRRYKRFLADIRLDDGREVTAHCANPGAMTGLAEPGQRIWVEPNDDPKKKLKFGWRLVDHENGHFTGVDTALPNRLIRAALAAQNIPEFAAYTTIRPEQRYGDNSRIDFLLSAPSLPDLYLEVKSVTLCRISGLAEFPDTTTARGARHLAELAKLIHQGHKAALLYLVQRTDCERVTIAADIDPAYAEAANIAKQEGVDMLAYAATLSPTMITLGSKLKFL